MSKNFLVLFSLLITFTKVSDACSATQEFDTSQLVVTQSSISYSDNDGRKMVTSIGNLKNESAFKADDIVLEVKYFDSENKLIDVVTQRVYDITIPQNKEVAFRVRDEADKPKNFYVTNSIRVISATKVPVYQENVKEKRSMWFDIFISWMPMLLLIGVWVYFIRRSWGKKGLQGRSVELMERQVSTLEKLLAVLEDKFSKKE